MKKRDEKLRDILDLFYQSALVSDIRDKELDIDTALSQINQLFNEGDELGNRDLGYGGERLCIGKDKEVEEAIEQIKGMLKVAKEVYEFADDDIKALQTLIDAVERKR